MHFVVILFVMVFVYSAQAGIALIGEESVHSTGAACTPCSDLGTSEFYWTGDYDADCGGSPSATEKLIACITGGSTRTGTLSAATISSDVSESTSTEHDGTWILDHTSVNDNLLWLITSSDIFNDEQGYLSFYLWLNDDSAGNLTIFEAYKNTGNSLCLFITGAETIRADHESANTVVSVSSSAITTGAWHQVEVKWDVSRCTDGDGFCNDANEDEISIQIDGGGWTGDTDSDDATAFTSDAPDVKIGDLDFLGAANTYYIDDLRIDTSYP